MGRTMVTATGSFQVVDDNGNTLTVTEYTTFIEVRPLSEPARWMPRTRSHKLQNGDHVNVHADGTYEHAATGKSLRRV